MSKSFTDNVGRFLTLQEAQQLRGAYRERKLAVGLKEDDYVRSEFFGLLQVQQLLNQPGCVGLRVHHAKRWEDADGNPTEPDTGDLKPRVLLTAVDSNGNDIPVRLSSEGLKDAAGRNGEALGEGHTCPQHCG